MAINPLKVLIGNEEASKEIKETMEEALREQGDVTAKVVIEAVKNVFGPDIIVDVSTHMENSPRASKVAYLLFEEEFEADEINIDFPNITVSISCETGVVTVWEDESANEDNAELNSKIFWQWFIESPDFADYTHLAGVDTFLVTKQGELTVYPFGEHLSIYQEHKTPWMCEEEIYVFAPRDGIVRVV